MPPARVRGAHGWGKIYHRAVTDQPTQWVCTDRIHDFVPALAFWLKLCCSVRSTSESNPAVCSRLGQRWGCFSTDVSEELMWRRHRFATVLARRTNNACHPGAYYPTKRRAHLARDMSTGVIDGVLSYERSNVPAGCKHLVVPASIQVYEGCTTSTASSPSRTAFLLPTRRVPALRRSGVLSCTKRSIVRRLSDFIAFVLTYCSIWGSSPSAKPRSWRTLQNKLSSRIRWAGRRGKLPIRCAKQYRHTAFT